MHDLSPIRLTAAMAVNRAPFRTLADLCDTSGAESAEDLRMILSVFATDIIPERILSTEISVLNPCRPSDIRKIIHILHRLYTSANTADKHRTIDLTAAQRAHDMKYHRYY